MTTDARGFAKVAGAVFVLVVAYSLATKVPDGRMAHDWLHSVLHLVSAAAGLLAGWVSSDAAPSRWFTVAIAAVYLPLGILGWFVDGLLLGTAAAIPLATADNVFHLLLGSAAMATLTAPRRSPHL